jgi:hypothetical protein
MKLPLVFKITVVFLGLLLVFIYAFFLWHTYELAYKGVEVTGYVGFVNTRPNGNNTQDLNIQITAPEAYKDKSIQLTDVATTYKKDDQVKALYIAEGDGDLSSPQYEKIKFFGLIALGLFVIALIVSPRLRAIVFRNS